MEGTFTEIIDLYDYEVDDGRQESTEEERDAREVLSYVDALDEGLRLITEDGLPICRRVFDRVHATLLANARGRQNRPGEIRQIQNLIGNPLGGRGSRFVPPPPEEVPRLVANLEKFYNQPTPHFTPLTRLAIAHYQFETIHPYYDGNGRLGRLLVPLALVADGVLDGPFLYISGYLESDKRAYVDALRAVSTHNEWLPWIELFLTAAKVEAINSVKRLNLLRLCRQSMRNELQRTNRSNTPVQLLDALFTGPIVTTRRAEQILDVTPRAARQNIEKLEAAGILSRMPPSHPQRFVLRSLVSILGLPNEDVADATPEQFFRPRTSM